jgi:hypothetical protein
MLSPLIVENLLKIVPGRSLSHADSVMPDTQSVKAIARTEPFGRRPVVAAMDGETSEPE